MPTFEPELGQSAFSNTPWQQYELSTLAVAALHAIGNEIQRVMGNITQEPYYAPTSSAGEAPFVTDVFSMLPYCWCGGDAHPDGCPPNFTWRNVQISWYKHLGRGTSSNIDLSPDLISELLDDCLASVREMDAS